jgi:hypothetical protein
MSKPRLDENAMMSELSESAFFRREKPFKQMPESSKKEESAHAPITVSAQSSKRPSAQPSFDLNHRNTEKRGYRFTKEEVWAIDDLKKDLNRSLELGVSQEDIVRIGVHYVIEDYRKNGGNSLVVKKVKDKTKR